MPEVRPEVGVDPWLSRDFFLRPKSRPRAVRKLDFFRFAGAPSPLWAVGASLKVEYRIALGGVVLWTGGDVLCGREVLGGEDLTARCPDDERLPDGGSEGA